MGLIRKLHDWFPITRGAFVAFLIVTVAYVFGQFQLGHVVDRVEVEAKRDTVRQCEATEYTKATLLRLLEDANVASRPRRIGESDAQYAERLAVADKFLMAYREGLAPKECR